MKKKRKKIINLICIIMLMTILISLIPTMTFAIGVSDTVNQYLTGVKNSEESMSSSPSNESIEKTINDFYSLTLDSYSLLNYTDYIIQEHEKILKFLNTLPDSERNKYIKIMYSKAVMSDYYTDISATTLLSRYPNLKDELPNETSKVLTRHPDIGQEVKSDYKPNTSKTVTLLPQEEQYLEKYKDDPNYGNETYKDVQYYTENNKCYRKINEYKGTEIIDSTIDYVSDNYTTCGYDGWAKDSDNTWDNLWFTHLSDYSNTNNTTDSNNSIKTSDESNLTLQYTFTKNDDYPIYYDSGIRVSLENTIKYSQIRDVMYQIATKKREQFIEDTDKFMTVLENKLFIYGNNDDIQYDKFENMFNNYENIEVRALDTKIGTKCSITDFLEIKKLKNITLDGKSVNIENKPIIRRNTTLFPIVDFAKLIGGKIEEENNDSVIITIGKDTIIFKNNEKYVNVNGNNTDIQCETIHNSKGVLMSNIYPMLDLAGYDMVWNTDNSTLELKGK